MAVPRSRTDSTAGDQVVALVENEEQSQTQFRSSGQNTIDGQKTSEEQAINFFTLKRWKIATTIDRAQICIWTFMFIMRILSTLSVICFWLAVIFCLKTLPFWAGPRHVIDLYRMRNDNAQRAQIVADPIEAIEAADPAELVDPVEVAARGAAARAARAAARAAAGAAAGAGAGEEAGDEAGAGNAVRVREQTIWDVLFPAGEYQRAYHMHFILAETAIVPYMIVFRFGFAVVTNNPLIWLAYMLATFILYHSTWFVYGCLEQALRATKIAAARRRSA